MKPRNLVPWAAIAGVSTFALVFSSVSAYAQTQNSNSLNTVVISDSARGSSNSAAVLNNGTTRLYNWSQASVANLSDANVIVLQRDAIPGVSTAESATKQHGERYDQAAYNAIMRSGYVKALRAALNRGAMIVFTGNSDKRLNDSLLLATLGLPADSAAVMNHGSETQAIAVYAPNDTAPLITSFTYYGITPNLNQIVSNADKYFEEGSMQQQQAAMVSPATASTGKTNPTVTNYGSYYEYDQTIYLYDSGEWENGSQTELGDMVVSYDLERVGTSSTSHEWAMKMHVTQHNTSWSNWGWENSAMWQGVDVSNYTGSEAIVQASPGSTITSSGGSVSVNVGLSGTQPSGGFGLTWNYTDGYSLTQKLEGSGTASDGWAYSFQTGTGSAQAGNSVAPGVNITNTAGALLVPVDESLSMVLYMYPSYGGDELATDSTGAQYYTIDVSDW